MLEVIKQGKSKNGTYWVYGKLNLGNLTYTGIFSTNLLEELNSQTKPKNIDIFNGKNGLRISLIF